MSENNPKLKIWYTMVEFNDGMAGGNGSDSNPYDDSGENTDAEKGEGKRECNIA